MKNLLEQFVKYKIWSNIIIIIVLGLGVVGLTNIKRTSFPIQESTTVSISVAYPGAAPEEIEEGIVLKIEQALQGLEGVKEITSVSRENLASVNVEGYSNYDIDDLVTEVKNSVDRINSFPTGAEKPTVFKLKQADLVGILILEGDIPMMDLKKYADQIEDELLQSPLISQVSIQGVPDLEISVEVPEITLRQHRLTFDDVANAIRRNNSDVAAGSIKTEDEEVLIRSNAKKYEAEMLKSIVLRSGADGSQLRLGDIANITEKFADAPDKTIYNGNNAIAININKLIDEDLIKIVDFVYPYVDNFNARYTDANVIFSYDNSQNLKERIDLLLRNGGTGLILVFIVLGLFLSVRLSGWVAFGIPFSFAAMLAVYAVMGGTINLISLFGMILIIGILVDDGIVIAENIYAHYEKGKSAKRAAIDGAAEILPSVLVSVTTTIIMFMIFFAVEGQPGLVMQTIATVVILCLAFSLIEAVFVLPAHLSSKSILKDPEEKAKSPINQFGRNIRKGLDKGISYLRDKVYGSILKVAINNYQITVIVPLIFIGLVMSAMIGRKISFTFFPSIPLDNVSINLTMPSGTRENITEEKLRFIEDKVWDANDIFKEEFGIDSLITSVRVTLGTSGASIGGPNGGSAGTSGANQGGVLVELAGTEVRGTLGDTEINSVIRRSIGPIPEAKEFTVGGFSFFGAPVSLSLRSTNLEELQGFKEDLKAQLATFSELSDISDNDIAGNREVQINLTDKAYALGLTQQEISRQIRQGFFGEEVQRLQKGKDEVKIWVRYPEIDRKSVGQMEEIRIKTPMGQEYPLTDLVTYEIGRSVININHIDGAREIRVNADKSAADVNVPDVLAEIRADVLPPLQAKYPSVIITEEGQARNSSDVFSKVQIALPIAMIGIFLLMALVFRSFSQSLMIFPMMIIGVFCAILGHGIEDAIQSTRTVQVSILSFFGILALMGVIVNDAVIFLNKYNLLIKEGFTVKKAAFEAGIARFRPIILTSITTVVGLYPIIFETSFQAEFLKPLAISMAYGVLFGTAFILLTFPAYIMLSNDLRRFFGFIFRGYWKTREEVEPIIREEKKMEEVIV